MKLFNRVVLRVIGVSVEAQALIGAWFAQTWIYTAANLLLEDPLPQPLRSTQGSLATAFSRYETARGLVKKARSFEDAPQRLLGRIIGKPIVRRIDALYATCEAYLHSDSLYEEAVANCSYERSVFGSALHYKVVRGGAWSPTDLVLIARHKVAGVDPFKGPVRSMLVFFGYDEIEYTQHKNGYDVNVLILAPEWVCNRLRSDELSRTRNFEAVDTCVDTVVAFWERGAFAGGENICEKNRRAGETIKIARLLDTPRPAHQKVS